ncbi:molybdopterin molybdotransferase MoeA [Ottowia thiooxydans]|uniref:Molybdopterin molybdenumtransferase n=1 Tax=Ottowia thiooxydans TaxID=219182 RepID=A0ABV2Q3R1_9BURK
MPADSPRRPPLMPLDEALERVLAQATPLSGRELVDTFEADGRVLMEDVVSGLQVPPQDNSAMDGYAVRAADVTSSGAVLPVTQRIAAGHAGAPLLAGSAARIFTGAPIPAGADAVVMQEDAEALDDGARVRIHAPPAKGQWVRSAGEDVTRGAVILKRGERLRAASIGLAAGIGRDRLQVSARPRVALFSTGDELVMPGETPPELMKPGAIYNSNRYFLRALLRQLGCAVTDLGIVPDQRSATLSALQSAADQHDLILTSGGVSVGEEDHIKPSVEELGALDLWQIGMKPGKPFAYGHVKRSDAIAGADRTHFVGLPGNPVSSFVTFLMLVRPFLLKLQGASEVGVASVAVRADFDWPKADKRREFLRARRNADGGLDLYPNQSSGVLTSAHWADGLVDNPAGATIAKGQLVRFIPMAEFQ